MTETAELQTNEEIKTTDQQMEEIRYAGKFRTVEELEAGYKNAAKVYQENEALKKQLEEVNKVPDDYLVPQGLELDVSEVKRIAKNAGLTQTQFEKLSFETQAKIRSEQENQARMVKELGEENLNILKDYVNNNYPEKIADAVMDKIIKDPDARNIALNHRTKLLNSSVPGLGSTGTNYAIQYDDVIKARDNANKNPSNLKARDSYLNVLSAYAKQNKR